MHKQGKWARMILQQQQPDGKWGWFHSLSRFSDAAMTTEQALRRLERLGFTMEDGCIQRAVNYMDRCLRGEDSIPDRREKVQDWDVFTRLILSTWLRRFTKQNPLANQVAAQWAQVTTAACAGGDYDPKAYEAAYREVLQPKGGRIGSPFNFYPVSLLVGELDEKTEAIWLDTLLQHPAGIYYIYDRCLSQLPLCFASRQASCYLDAVEMLARYDQAGNKLSFVAQWLKQNRDVSGQWDMGKAANDKIRFPLSDDWRTNERRIADCTERIRALLDRIDQ